MATPIPRNITKEHLLQAIYKIEKEGIPFDGRSTTYDVIYNGKTYPPKLIVSYANLFANGTVLDRNTFEGGKDTPCFKLLEKEGFEIQLKDNNFFSWLITFLDQAQTTDIKTKKYPSTYLGKKLRVSFGMGNVAEIPWIAFLQGGQTVPKGTYPVYLYYKKQNILILAYGISETNPTEISWQNNSPTIDEYFKNELQDKPKRYGTSQIFKIYSIRNGVKNFGLENTSIEADLKNVLTQYDQLFDHTISHHEMPTAFENKEFDVGSFIEDLKKANLIFSDLTIQRFVASLQAKPFLILTGLAGSGKTKLAISFASWIAASEIQVAIVPVGADWVNREPLLGFENVLQPDQYVKPSNGALQVIIDANKDYTKPYFLILDEMNLSHVERYFADFLSVMESGGSIGLHNQEPKGGIPQRLNLPPNLFIIGTVNIDETTYMFSPKVLDRANVIEFRVSHYELKEYLESGGVAVNNSYLHKGSHAAYSFLEQVGHSDLIPESKNTINNTIEVFFKELQKIGAEFGYRSVSEIYRLIAKLRTFKDITLDTAIDVAIMQKLLPKLHGSRRKLVPVLETMGNLCLSESGRIKKITLANEDKVFDEINDFRFPISFEKIKRMYLHAVQDGFTSYAEA